MYSESIISRRAFLSLCFIICEINVFIEDLIIKNMIAGTLGCSNSAKNVEHSKTPKRSLPIGKKDSHVWLVLFLELSIFQTD